MNLQTCIARAIEDLIVQREEVVDSFKQSMYTKAIEVLDSLSFEVSMCEDNAADVLDRHLNFWSKAAFTAGPNSSIIKYYMVVFSALTGIWCKYNLT